MIQSGRTNAVVTGYTGSPGKETSKAIAYPYGDNEQLLARPSTGTGQLDTITLDLQNLAVYKLQAVKWAMERSPFRHSHTLV